MKKTFLFFVLCGLVFVQINAQNSIALVDNDTKAINLSTDSESITSSEIDINKFKIVERAVIQKLQSEVEYPELAMDYNVEGTVLLQFTFDGTIKDIKVKKSLGAGCDEVAIKAIKNFPNLYQEMGGEPVNPIQITIPFKFLE